MKLLGTRRLRLLALGFVLGPPALWGLVLAVVPTDWARVRLVRRLAETTGQPVRLDAVRLGVLGGVRLGGLEIGDAEADGGAWLRVQSLSVDLNLAQLATGRLEPGDVRADGVALRILRRRDGSLEFGDLLRADPRPAPATTSIDCPLGGPSALAFRLDRASVTVIDEPSGTRLEFADVAGRGTWQHQRVDVGELHGGLNGGRFELAGGLDRGPLPAFEGQVRAEGVGLGVGMDVLGYLVPVLAGKRSGVDGKLDIDLYLRGQGTGAELRRSLVGQGTVVVDPIGLDDSPLMAELAGVVALPKAGRVGSARGDFVIKDRRVVNKNLTIEVARVPIVLVGWTDFDGRLDYRVQAEGLADRISADARGLLKELPIDLDDLMDLRVVGTLDRLAVTVDGLPLTARPEDRDRLRHLGRRLRDRLLR